MRRCTPSTRRVGEVASRSAPKPPSRTSTATPNAERQPRPACFAAVVGQGGGRCEHHDHDEGETPNADDGEGLRERQRSGERVAKCIPRETGQDMAAQPFRRGQRYAQSEDTQRATRPNQACQHDAQRHVDRGDCGQADHRDRQQPAEGRSIDQKGVADPIKSGEEIAKTEPPAGCRGCRQAAPPAHAYTVDQPHQRRKCQEQNRPGVKRRHRQRRQGAGDKCDQPAPPAPSQNDAVNQPLKRHGVRGMFELGRPASSRNGAGRAGCGRAGAGSSRAAAGRRSLRR